MVTAPVSVAVLLDQLDAARAKAGPEYPAPWRQDSGWGENVLAADGGTVAGSEWPSLAACIVAEHNATPRLVAAVRAVLELADELEGDAQRQVDAFPADSDALPAVVGRSWVNACRQFRAAVASALAEEGA